MTTEYRRSKRFTDFIPVSVYVMRKDRDETVAGPFAATIVDICSYGACLLMSNMTSKSFHIYHSTRKDDSAYLHIRIESPKTLEGSFLDARPVWLNTFQREDFRERMIGVEFLAAETMIQNLQPKP